jgi:hypothetical protein
MLALHTIEVFDLLPLSVVVEMCDEDEVLNLVPVDG